jgi:hypothetical protein
MADWSTLGAAPRCPECGAPLARIREETLGPWDAHYSVVGTLSRCTGMQPHLVFTAPWTLDITDYSPIAAEGLTARALGEDET